MHAFSVGKAALKSANEEKLAIIVFNVFVCCKYSYLFGQKQIFTVKLYIVTFYYYRPVNVYAAHGYGPVIWAGAEMINLLNKQHPKMNDSAIQFYHTEQKTQEPIFSVTDSN